MPGDFAVVMVEEASGHTLRGNAVARTTMQEHAVHGGDRGVGVANLVEVLEAARITEAEVVGSSSIRA